MSQETRNFIALESVIYDYIDESEQSQNKYAKLYNIAYRGMEQLGIDFFYKVKSVKIPVDKTNFTAPIPTDYINYTKIGVLNAKGEIIPLKFNNKLTTFADFLPERVQKTQDNTLINWYYPNTPMFYNYWDGYGFTNIYGLPSGTPSVGSFMLDLNAGLVLLSQNFDYDYIMIEYLSSPNPDEQYMIPIVFREALISWLAWRDIASMPNTRRGTISDKAERKREFYNQRRQAMARFKPLYLSDAYEQNLEAQRLTVKA